MLISFSGRTKQILFSVIKLEPRLLSWLHPRKINFAPTELDVSISAYVSSKLWSLNFRRRCLHTSLRHISLTYLHALSLFLAEKLTNFDSITEPTLLNIGERIIGSIGGTHLLSNNLSGLTMTQLHKFIFGRKAN